MASVLKEMIKVYGIGEYDWMNFKITKENPLTFHHIKKEEYGGTRTIDNGALLSQLSHSYLHKIERMDKKTFNKISLILKRINENKAPTEEDLKEIDALLTDFELRYYKSLNKYYKELKLNHEAIKRVFDADTIKRKLGENIDSKTTISICHPTNMRMVMQEGISPKKVKTKHSKKKK